jgi:hypothetical protein
MVVNCIAIGVDLKMSRHTYKVGDENFIQTDGGPIGLEMTTAVSRLYMMSWDEEYQNLVQETGIEMQLYKRYVDDSNQYAEIPPPGTKYNADKRELEVAEDCEPEEDDQRLARVLREIANSVTPEIVMEEDFPSKNPRQKLADLELEVWTDKDGFILYQHYEKPMASKLVMMERSAHSQGCKRSVHVQEIIRRARNCSLRLDWGVATSAITDYMVRMKQGGYSEDYRYSVLCQALKVYRKMRDDHCQGVRPMYRPREWEMEERREVKRKKRSSWFQKGGFIAPIMVPPTPKGELAKLLREITEKEAQDGIKFKIIEHGGSTMKSILQKSNPTASDHCDESGCMVCRSGNNRCRVNGVGYKQTCQLCPTASQWVYIGETARNAYTRGKEHFNKALADPSYFLRSHTDVHHPGQDVNFDMEVVKCFRDTMTRQVDEGVRMRRCEQEMLNGKSMWHQPSVFQIRSELEQS